MKIKKAIIPAAGFGTRVLPASKAVPKEMINIVDKPAIQYIVEEAVAAGIEDILIIVSRGKGIIEDHFDHAYELERQLEGKKGKELKTLRLYALDLMGNLYQGKIGAVRKLLSDSLAGRTPVVLPPSPAAAEEPAESAAESAAEASDEEA